VNDGHRVQFRQCAEQFREVVHRIDSVRDPERLGGDLGPGIDPSGKHVEASVF
jgi:hypothetical protein